MIIILFCFYLFLIIFQIVNLVEALKLKSAKEWTKIFVIILASLIGSFMMIIFSLNSEVLKEHWAFLDWYLISATALGAYFFVFIVSFSFRIINKDKIIKSKKIVDIKDIYLFVGIIVIFILIMLLKFFVLN